MKTVPHRRESTDAQFTSRAGLSVPAEVMSRLGPDLLCDRMFPALGNNHGFHPGEYVMMLNEVGRCLEDVRRLHSERALLSLSGMARIPSADAMGDWFRRMGRGGVGRKLTERANAARRRWTLIPTAVLCGKKHARRTCPGWAGLHADGWVHCRCPHPYRSPRGVWMP